MPVIKFRLIAPDHESGIKMPIISNKKIDRCEITPCKMGLRMKNASVYDVVLHYANYQT